MFGEVLAYVTEETGKTDPTSWLGEAASGLWLGFVFQSPLNNVLLVFDVVAF